MKNKKFSAPPLANFMGSFVTPGEIIKDVAQYTQGKGEDLHLGDGLLQTSHGIQVIKSGILQFHPPNHLFISTFSQNVSLISYANTPTILTMA